MLGPEIQFTDREYIVFEGKKLLYLAGTDYHRMSTNPVVLEAASEAVKKYGLNPTGSRSTTGNHTIIAHLEKKVAEFFATEAAVVLPSGYLSNSTLLQCIATDYDVLLLDEKAHPSLVDAANQVMNRSGHKIYRFRHVDSQDLEEQLEKNISPGSKPLIMTDGVFPANGDIPPLKEYIQVIGNYGGKVLLDDAHAMAIVGKSGKGSWEEKGIDREFVFQTGTLSKGFGTFGGTITGENELIDHIYEKSSAFVGSTGLALPLAAAAISSISYLTLNPDLITGLQERTKSLKMKFRDLGFEMPDTSVPIFSITFQKAEKNQRLKKKLIENGIYPPFIIYPGSPPEGHFRLIITSLTTTEQIDLLIESIKSVV
ncbi:aminotransferase class I/II-fold pyridoxal phosphate-dependent enzyme [Bacteroidota bacterium]